MTILQVPKRIKLTPLLTEHAIIQRHQTIPVWGWTDQPKTRLRASLGTSSAEGISAEDGRFLLRLPQLDAGGPYTLTVETLDGSERLEVNDILVGEVWLASGQSNMQWAMENADCPEEIANAHPGQIRMINVARRADLAPQSTVVGKWELSTPGTVPQFSAVATFFGNHIQDELDIPVGIIHSSWGGSRIETWISRERLLHESITRRWVEEYDQHAFSSSAWGDSPARLYPADPGNEGIGNGWHQPELDDGCWDIMDLPAAWQHRGHDYSAVMWFRRRIKLPGTMVGKYLELHLGGIDKTDITYVNGVEVGRTGEEFDETVYAQNRLYPLPAELTQAGELVIAVRAYSFVFAGGLIGPAAAMHLSLPEGSVADSIPLTGNWQYQVEHNFGLVQTPNTDTGHGCHNSPHMCFENMIKPMLPVGIAGAIWYQGESNANRFEPEHYTVLLRALIEDWRYLFGIGDFPLGIVQLPNFKAPADFQAESSWAVLREAQLRTLTVPNTGLAVTIDVGEADDIHPPDKRDVGFRLAQWALADVYRKPVVRGGPIPTGHRVEGTRVRILFDNAPEGLALRTGDTVKALFVAGENGKFIPADSAIEGTSLLVWNDRIDRPASVRYAWADNPDKANLTNTAGLPASPFSMEA